MKTPIEKTQTVPLTPSDAFALFTENMDTWWPKDPFSVTGATSTVTFPNHNGGDIIETGADGSTNIWGTISAYDPGTFLAFSWHPGRGPEEATMVTVSFTETADGTRCDLTHGGFEILGETADAVSASYLSGWDLVLGRYVAAVKAPALT